MMHPLHAGLRYRRSVILILTLWIAMILTVMAYSTAYELRINLRLARQSQDQLRAYALARTGLAKAVMDLRNDKLLGRADPRRLLNDCFVDVWAQTEDKTDVRFGGGRYTVRIEDEQGKLNINFINERSSPILGFILFRIAEFDIETANMLASMILDYQDADSISMAGQGESEFIFWTQWARDAMPSEVDEEWAFIPRNSSILTLEELLQFPGITMKLLYGDPREVDRRQPRSLRRNEDESNILADYITLGPINSLNINTVSQTVLEGLLRVALISPGGAQGLARKVAEYRRSREREREDSACITNILELESAGLDRRAINDMLNIMPIGTISTLFTITSRGEYGGISKTIQVRVEARVEHYRINPDIPDSYGRRGGNRRPRLRDRDLEVIDPAIRVVAMREL